MRRSKTRRALALFMLAGSFLITASCASDDEDLQEQIDADVQQQEDQQENYKDDEANFSQENAAQFAGDQIGAEQGDLAQQGDLQAIIEEMNESGNELGVADQGAFQQEQGFTQDVGVIDDQAAGGFDSFEGSAPAMGGGLPERGSKMSYIVEQGDTLGKIASKIYGSTGKWKEIADFSGLLKPSLIYPGDVVYYQLTEATAAFASAYENLPRSEVEVQKGDTLSSIALRVLGSTKHWKSIWRHNDNINNPDRLKEGTVLYYVEPGTLNADVYDHNPELLRVVSLAMKKAKPVKIPTAKVENNDEFSAYEVEDFARDVSKYKA